MNAEQKAIAEEIFYMLDQEHITPVEALTAMEALLQELINAPEPEPVAHAILLPNGATRIWFSDRDSGELWRARERVEQELTPLYTSPPAKNQSEHHLEMVNTPAASVPVLTVECEPDYWSGGHYYEGTKPYIAPTAVWKLPIGTELYTSPPAKNQSEQHLEMVNPQAPSVPDVAQTIPSHDQITQILNGLDRCGVAESKRAFLRTWIRDWTAHKLSAAPKPAEAPADVAHELTISSLRKKLGLPEHCAERRILCAIDELIAGQVPADLVRDAAPDIWRVVCGDWREETVAIHNSEGWIADGLDLKKAAALVNAHNGSLGLGVDAAIEREKKGGAA